MQGGETRDHESGRTREQEREKKSARESEGRVCERAGERYYARVLFDFDTIAYTITNTNIHAYEQIRAYIHPPVLFLYNNIHAHKHTRTHIHTNKHTLTQIHTHMSARTCPLSFPTKMDTIPHFSGGVYCEVYCMNCVCVCERERI